MADIAPAQRLDNNEDKSHSPQEAIIETSQDDTATVEKDDGSSQDGDDALKLAGTHAHQFDEKYFQRLRRKIVSSVHICGASDRRN